MPDELAQQFARYADTFTAPPPGDFDDVRRRNGSRRRRTVLTATTVILLICATGLVFATANKNHKSQPAATTVNGHPLTGRTWYLQSVTRLGRTWTPQAVSTLTFQDGSHISTFDSASMTHWKLHHTGSTISGGAVDGEQEAGGGGPVSYQISVALQALLTGNAQLALNAGTLTIAGAQGQLRYGTAAPPLAPTGAVNARAQVKTTGSVARFGAATLFVTDAEQLQLWQYAPPAGHTDTLTDLATGSYTLSATLKDGICVSVHFAVHPGHTATATVECTVHG